MSSQYEGTGESLEEAVAKAHMQIPISAGRDFTVSRVVDWGMQYGGFVPVTVFYAMVEEDPNASFRTRPDS
jgi:hypothetical protein